jgi:uncharacterized protein with PIN domain
VSKVDGLTPKNIFKIRFGSESKAYFVDRWTRIKGYPTASYCWYEMKGKSFNCETEAVVFISSYKRAKILIGKKFVLVEKYINKLFKEFPLLAHEIKSYITTTNDTRTARMTTCFNCDTTFPVQGGNTCPNCGTRRIKG